MAKHRFDVIAINSTEKKKPTEEDKYVYIGLEHLDPECLQVTRFGSEVAPIGEKLVMKEGDVLFGKRRAYQRKVAIAPFNGIFSAHGMVLRPRTEVISKEFFPFFISSKQFLDAAIQISVGSLSPTINWRDIAELEFSLPPIEEQSKLAELLWAFENTRKAYRGLLAKTDELVKAQFIEMFGSDKYPKIRIGDLLKQHTECEYITDTLDEKYVTVALYGKGVRERSIERYDPKPFSAYRVKPKQFIYSRIDARNGAFGIIPDALNQAVVSKDFPVFYVDYDRVTPDFLIKSVLDENFVMQIKQNSRGSTNRQRIKEEIFLNYKISLPPIAQQKGFASFMEQTDKSKSALQQSIESLERCRNALMEKMSE